MSQTTPPPPVPPTDARSDRAPQPEESLRVRARRRSRRALDVLDTRARPHLTRSVPALLICLLCYVVGINLGGVRRSTRAEFDLFGWRFDIPAGGVVAIVLGLAVVFVLSGVIAGRSIARELGRVSADRASVAAGSAVRLICMIVVYMTVGFGVLSLIQVDLGNLLIGGAVTGVVVGIAAQQTLGNFFAGLVLLFARPYVPGQRVTVRSGAMGGPFTGVITGAGLMYTTIETSEGLVSMPNSGLLGAAVGPAAEPEPAPDDEGHGQGGAGGGTTGEARSEHVRGDDARSEDAAGPEAPRVPVAGSTDQDDSRRRAGQAAD